jgi:hypothetical protein
MNSLSSFIFKSEITHVHMTRSLFTMWLVISIAVDSHKLSTKCTMKYNRSSTSYKRMYIVNFQTNPSPTKLIHWLVHKLKYWLLLLVGWLVGCSWSLWFPMFWTHFLELDKGFQTDHNHGVNFACLGATTRPDITKNPIYLQLELDQFFAYKQALLSVPCK